MNFPREYKTLGIPSWLLIGVAVLGIVLGLFLMGPVGGVIWIAPVILTGVFGLIWLFIPNVTVTCTSEGFTFTEQRRVGGGSSTEIRWPDVTETEYFEKVVGHGKNRRVENFFQARAASGSSVTIPTTLRFHELIETFNAMTPHLPYVWRKRGVLQGLVGLNYEKAPRSEAATPVIA